jgi:hypothetical protein
METSCFSQKSMVWQFQGGVTCFFGAWLNPPNILGGPGFSMRPQTLRFFPPPVGEPLDATGWINPKLFVATQTAWNCPLLISYRSPQPICALSAVDEEAAAY